MDYAEYSDQLNRLGKRYWQDGINTFSDYARAVGDLAKREQSVDGVLQFAKQEGVDFAKRLYQCNADYYTGLFNAALGLNQNLARTEAGQQWADASAVRAETITASAQPASTSATGWQTELYFKGKRGDAVNQAFVIANSQPEAVDISFEVSEFVSDGQHKVRLPVTVTPSPVTLEQNQEQVMHCQIQLGDELTPGQRYQAIARVVGFPQMMVRLLVDV